MVDAHIRWLSLEIPDAFVLQVLIVADDPLVRVGLTTLLADQPDYQVAGEASVRGDVQRVIDLFEPDVVVWDLGWGEFSNAKSVRFTDLGVPVVALVPDEGLITTAWRAGARVLLPRRVEAETLMAALTAARHDLVVLDPAFARSALHLPERPQPAEPLTPREHQVLQLLTEGLSNKQIAARLSISVHTVKFHVNAILSKLGVHSRTEAVAQAARSGWILL